MHTLHSPPSDTQRHRHADFELCLFTNIFWKALGVFENMERTINSRFTRFDDKPISHDPMINPFPHSDTTGWGTVC